MDKHLQHLNERLKRPPAPWLTQSITELMRKRGSTFRLFKCARISSSMKAAQLFETSYQAATHMLECIVSLIASESPVIKYATPTVPLHELKAHFLDTPVKTDNINLEPAFENNYSHTTKHHYT
ncbi:hypothetical protein PR048_016412 [Dryococelus australis]|uniref:Uncharacterized protein n=1 Tax=Dryococelus australis TaxID=614101 RepID=A0ABQ9HJV1_9NEOP|nr:hypothetical protein PR048_016412 [Dryococelus australis]